MQSTPPPQKQNMPVSSEPGEKGPDTPESGAPAAAPASEEDARHFVFEIARGMLSDGLQTGETVRVATELGQRLGQEVILMPRWGELIMRTRQPNHRHDLLDIARRQIGRASCRERV